MSAEVPSVNSTPEKSKVEDQDFALSSQANSEFSKCNYKKCLETLAQLEKLSGSSSRIGHNRAVVQFYKSENKDYRSLLKVLDELDFEEEDKSKPYSMAISNNAITRYNKAVIYFHQRMYEKAIETLSPVLENLDALDTDVIARVGLITLKLLLITNQLSRAQAFLEDLRIRLGYTLDIPTFDECSTSENIENLNGFSRGFKLLSMLTNVLNRKPVVIPEDDSVEYATMKAHQYYIMKDFQMAAKQLKRISDELLTKNPPNTEEIKTCIANNMGVIHLRVRHYAIAAQFFQNALNFDKHVVNTIRSTALCQMNGVHFAEIFYNLGISLLHLRRPVDAFTCLLIPCKFHHSNPRLWFRIAEACIMDHEMKRLAVGKRKSQSPVDKKNIATNTKPNFTLYKLTDKFSATPGPSLECASLSLCNALALTRYYAKSFQETDSEGANVSGEKPNWRHVKDNNFCRPSKPISKTALDNMLAAIYAAYSYVALRLGDPFMALKMAQDLLKLEKLSDAHKMIGHMYAGEALIMMDMYAEARPHLEPTFVSSLNAFDFETKDWQIKSLDAAQNVVRYNLAVAMTLQGDFDTAKSLLNTCTHPITASKVISLKMYLDVRMGKTPVPLPC